MSSRRGQIPVVTMAKGGELDTAEPEEIAIAQDECLGNKAEKSVVKEITPEESDLAHRSEDLEERVDTGSTMAVTEGDLFCDKQMTPNKNLRAANPKKRGEPEKSSKSKRSGNGAMTLKVEDPPLVLTTLNEEWTSKMHFSMASLYTALLPSVFPAFTPHE